MRVVDAVTAADSRALAVYEAVPPAPAKAVVQILHGMAEHAGRYAGLVADLTRAGYVVVAHDQRGHGLSAADRLGHLADSDGARLLVDDALRVGAWARTRHPGLPFALLGHSMGSALARVVAQEQAPIDALVLSGPPASVALERRAGAALARAAVAAGGGRRRNHLLDKLTFGTFNAAFAPARTRFDWLSRDAATVDAYVTDPRCGFVCTSSFFVDLFTILGQAADRRRTTRVSRDLPVYVLGGEEDPAGRRGAAVSRIASDYHRAGLHDVTTRLYPGGRHEMFHEVDRDVVVGDLVAWLDRITARVAASYADVIPLRRRGEGGDEGRRVGSCH